MEYYLEERIGNPDLFTGRKNELSVFRKWISDIKDKKSKSTAILARRKMGKSALMERLYNITFAQDNGIIPFFYEVREGKKWVVDFSTDFFLTFIYQYIAFKSRKREYLLISDKTDFDIAINAAKKEGLDYLISYIVSVKNAVVAESADNTWLIVRESPRFIAELKREFIIQIVDEFQFMNSEIYRDKNCSIIMNDLAGSYLNTAESKIAPLLVSGSWVGWLMNALIMQLPARFRFTSLDNMPEGEAVEMICKYSQFFEVPISENVIYSLYELTEGSPFYISSIIRSNYAQKDLTNQEGLLKVIEFETLDYRGEIKSTWMEYVTTAFSRVNDRNAKNIVLYLCKNRKREVTRKELLDNLKLDMSDYELEKRLKALVMADIINQGRTNFDYQGVKDNIFDKVFRGVYQKEIEAFDAKDIVNEYKTLLEEATKKYQSLLGKHNYQKGYFAEFILIHRLKYDAYKNSEYFKSITFNLPDDFEFVDYKSVWRYKVTPEYSREMDIDIFAHAKENGYSIIGEVKNRETKTFDIEEAKFFYNKINELKTIENLKRYVGFVFSRSGFTNNAKEFCLQNGIAYSCDEQWLSEFL